MVQLLRQRPSPASQPIANYLNALPYHVETKCEPGDYYNAVNVNPAFTPKGSPSGAGSIPPVTMRSIGDVLSAANIPWKYYGNGFNAGTGAPPDGTFATSAIRSSIR